MPLYYLNTRNTFFILLVAFLAVLSPIGFSTDRSAVVTGLDRLTSRLSGLLRLASIGFHMHWPSNIFRQSNASESTASDTLTTTMGSTSKSSRTPVYFFSHGGPTIMDSVDHPAYAKLQEIGLEITQKVKPKAIVVFSAHWQGDRDAVEVNVAESQGLIYDYYGFPPHYYEIDFPNKGSPELAERLIQTFGDAGIKAEGVRRGLDHGVFAGFMVAFNPKTNPLNVPIVEVSLFDSDDPDKHYRLGAAVSSLRDEGIVIIGSGASVHNLMDFRRALMAGRRATEPMPYALSFDEATKEAVEQPAEERQKALNLLLKRPDARKAHPTFEHLLPLHIAAGAAANDTGKQTWTMAEGALGWAQYRFGDLAA